MPRVGSEQLYCPTFNERGRPPSYVCTMVMMFVMSFVKENHLTQIRFAFRLQEISCTNGSDGPSRVWMEYTVPLQLARAAPCKTLHLSTLWPAARREHSRSAIAV